MDRIHADAVAQQRAARFSPRRVDRDDRDSELVVLVEAEAADELVGQRALPAPPVPVIPTTGALLVSATRNNSSRSFAGTGAGFEAGDHSRQRLVGEIGVRRP